MIALIGWLFLFGTSGWLVVADGLGTLQLGMEAFAIRDRVVARHSAEASEAAPS